MSDITTDDIKYVAQLSKLQLSDDELEKFRVEMSKIVDYFNQLAEFDLDQLEPTAQVSGLTNQSRPDEIADTDQSGQLYSVPQAELLDNTADHTDQGYIKVDKVL